MARQTWESGVYSAEEERLFEKPISAAMKKLGWGAKHSGKAAALSTSIVYPTLKR